MTTDRWRQSVLIAALIALALAMAALAPMSVHPGSYLYAYAHPGDAMISIWTIWVYLQAFSGSMTLDHVTLVAAPHGVNLLGYPPELVTAWPFFWLARAIGDVAAFNILILLSFPLAAASMALLTFHVTRSRGAATVSGLLYAFLPYHLAHTVHLSLGATQWLPLALWAWFRLQERPGFSRACALAAVSLAVLWATAYYAYLLAVASLVFVIWAFSKPREGASRRIFFGWGVGAMAMTAAIAGLRLIPFFKTAGVAHLSEVGAALQQYGRPLKDLFVFAAKPWDYFLPSIRNPWFGPLVQPFATAHLYGSNVVEQTLYLGAVPLALTVLAWRHRRTLDPRVRDAMGYGLALAVVALWWSAPPYIPLGAFRIEQNEIVSTHRLWFPAGLIYHTAPALRFLRVYARFGLLVGLAVSVLAGIGWMALMRQVVTPWRRWAVAAILIVISCAEFSVAAPSWNIRTSPPVYDWLAKQPDGLIVEYPFCRSTDSVHAEYLFWQRLHQHPMVNGAPGGSGTNPFRDTLVDLTNPETAVALRSLNVRYVVVHRERYAHVARPPAHIRVLGVGYDVPRHEDSWRPAPPKELPGLRLMAVFDDTLVYTPAR